MLSGLTLGPIRLGVKEKKQEKRKRQKKALTPVERFKLDHFDPRIKAEKKYDAKTGTTTLTVIFPDDAVPTRKQIYFISKGLALIAEAFNEEHHGKQTSD